MFVNVLKYHKLRLPTEAREIYNAIDDAVKHMKDSCTFPITSYSVDERWMRRIWQGVYNDNPSYFYYTPIQYVIYRYDSCIRYEIKYLYQKHQVRQMKITLGDFMRKFYSKYSSKPMTDYNKVKLIHGFLVATVSYDYEALESADVYADPDIFNVIGVFFKRRAVCWGIAMAFKLLCDYFGVSSLVITGKGGIDSVNEEHAWNLVRLDGEFYHIDVTWGLRKQGKELFIYDYFNLDDGVMGKIHDWDRKYYPQCKSLKHNYHHMKNYLVDAPQNIRPYFLKRLQQGVEKPILKYLGILPNDEFIQREISLAVREHLGWVGSQFTSWSFLVDRRLQNIYVTFKKE